MKLKRILFLISFLYFSLHLIEINAQETNNKPTIGKGSIEGQFNYVIYKSDKQDNSRLVKSWWLYTLKKQVEDSLNALHIKLTESEKLSSKKSSKIDTLNASLSTINAKLKSVNAEKDSIKLLGINMNKKMYNNIMWTIIAILVIVLFIFIALFKRSHAVTSKTKQRLNEVKDEFEEFRKLALEGKQKAVREVYDELLKYKNKVRQ